MENDWRFVVVRLDGSSGWQRENVRVGSLPTDPLFQKSGQLQSHQDQVQPPGKQGEEQTSVGLVSEQLETHSPPAEWVGHSPPALP